MHMQQFLIAYMQGTFYVKNKCFKNHKYFKINYL
jgi:hypothetical protein